MFKKILLVILILVLPVFAHATNLKFSWEPNTDSTEGYKVLYGTASRTYTEISEAGFPDPIDGRIYHTVEDVPEGITYFFDAIAYMGDEGVLEGDRKYIESAYSQEVEHTVIPTPKNFHLEQSLNKS